MRGIVTPEAVLLEFQTASVATRVLQFSLDVLVQFAALTAALLVFAAAGSTGIDIPESVAVIFVVVAFFLVLLGYPIAMETLWNGRTLGMAAVGLRVVTTEGAPIRFRHAAIRGALGLIDFWLVPVGVIATVVILLTRDNQRLGDLAAGTLVVYRDEPPKRPQLPEADAERAPFSLSLVEQRALLDFAERSADLSAARRAELAGILAEPLESLPERTEKRLHGIARGLLGSA